MKKMGLALPIMLISVTLFLWGCATDSSPPKLLTPEQLTTLTSNIANDICAVAPTATTIAVTVESSLNSSASTQKTTSTASKAIAVGCQAINTSTKNGTAVTTTIVPVTTSTGTVVIPTEILPATTTPSQ